MIFGGGQTGGEALVRLLGHVGFCEVHADYKIADLEPGRSRDGHAGILMIRGPEKMHRMPKGELLAIHEGVLFDHYLPWCETSEIGRPPTSANSSFFTKHSRRGCPTRSP